MRELFYAIFVCTFFGVTSVHAQTTIIDESFTDGDLTTNPVWTDVESKHVVNGSNRLQLDAPEIADEAAITTPSTAAYGEWETFIQLGFNPSGSNLSRFYLLSDTQYLKGDITGYYVQIGDTQDEISLYRQDGNRSTKIIDGTDDLLDTGSISVRIRVTRDIDGNWELLAATGGPSTPFMSQGTVRDINHTSSSFIGFFSDYTSTRSDRFEYDDITVTKINPPLRVEKVTLQSAGTIDVRFNLEIDPASVSASNFSLDNSIGAPDAAELSSPDVVRLTYSSPLPGNQYTLTINNIDDADGNTISPNSTISLTTFDTFAPGDLIISEFMYDPPGDQAEYVELKNRSDKFLNLQNWQIGDEANNATLATKTLALRPDSYLVISSDTASLFSTYGDQPYAQSANFPAFNNGGDIVKVITANGSQVDSLRYTPAWGGDNVALERRSDAKNLFFMENFGDSPNALGGTPGLPNEIAEDTTPPDLQNLEITDNRTLDLAFTERLERGAAQDRSNYTLNNGITIGGVQQTNGDSLRLNLSSPLQNATEYLLSVNNQQDIFGNTLGAADTSFTYFEVSPADSGDIFINEFSYDPPEGSTEYIELYNPSSKSFDLNGWTINDNTGNRRTITDGSYIVPPKNYAILAPDQTLTDSLSDISLLSMGSNFPSLNNSGDNIVLRNEAGQRLDSLQYRSAWGGKEVALERRTVQAATFQSNFGDAPGGFGSPGRKNNIGEDTIAPKLAAFSILSKQLLEFVFSEPLESETASKSDHYKISEDIGIRSAALFGDDTIRVALAEPLQNNTQYTASISEIADLFGNKISKGDTTFTYFKVYRADSGDIFVNEFMYDPPAGEAEFIELYNPTGRSLDLQNWTLNDNTGNRRIITDQSFIVRPGNFAVLAPDQTLLKDYPDIALVTMGSRFPSFNNSGDDLVLRNQHGQLLDSLRYTSGWGGDEISLERRTPSVAALQPNFGDSPDGFGTPGFTNLLPPDEQPPTLQHLQIVDNTTIRLIFSETVTSGTATDEDHYAISPNRNIKRISSRQDTVTLVLSQVLASELGYELNASGIQDVFGNTLKRTSSELNYVKFSVANMGSIIINEFLYRRESTDSPEFVELFNPTAQNFDLSGWALGDARSTAKFDAGTQIRAGDYLVLTDSESLANRLDNAVFISNFPSLNNDEDAIYIQNATGATIDSLFYSSDFGGDVDGKSAERKDPKAASNDPANFATGTADKGSTPGAQNSVFAPDEASPFLNFARIFPNGDIEVRFSEFITLSDDVQFSINGQPLSVDSFNPNEGNRIFLNTPEEFEAGSELNLSVQNLSDVKGNATLEAQIEVARLLKPGDVVINEILYDPIDDSDDNRPDQNEYLELRNTRDFAVSLEGISLHDAADEDGETRMLNPVSSRSKYVPAHGTALIYASETLEFKDSPLAEFFEIGDQPAQTLIHINRSSLSMASNDDAIYLTGTEGVEIDSVFYDESWHNPNLVDTKGIALERINPEGASNEASNWGSSTDDRGGTPNEENTQYQTPGGESRKDIGISFSPNPFSPDDDGTDDRLFINYKLGQSDYLITVHIYDRYGRQVRELTDGKPAVSEGSLIWDGLKDNGNRNRIGIYIVIFKAFDSAGGRTKTFKETVVLARRLN